jgi:Arc/MetJ family transcription regulator
MRTNIVIDEKLMAAALKASGARTKREAVEMGLRTLLQLNSRPPFAAFAARCSAR